jgi:hypothetical protein
MAKITLKVKSQMNLDNIESLYTLFRRYKGEIDLQLPNKMKETGAFGVIPALIQLIGTWIRFNSNSRILSSIDSKSINFKDQLEEFINSEIGFCCAALIDSIEKEISFVDVNSEKINEFLHYQERFDAMKHHHRMKGDKIFLTCFDHLGQYGLIPQFYLDYDKLNSEQDIKELLISKILGDVLKNVSKSQRPTSDLVEDLTRIIYELMENTHSWGRNNYNGQKNVRPNVRGTFVKFHQIGSGNVTKYVNSHDGLTRYFTSYMEKSAQKKLLSFLEISIFDLGSGFASVFSQLPISAILNKTIKDEVNIVKSCLTKNNTTASNSPYRRGLGLNNVLKTLNHKGFIRIRSGRTALFRDLISTPYEEDHENGNNVILFDWQNETKDYFNQMDWSAGSLLTFLLPLDYNASL